jgi:hypothetical protein
MFHNCLSHSIEIELGRIMTTYRHRSVNSITSTSITTLSADARSFHSADRHFLQALIVTAYLGWLVLTLMFICYHYTPLCAHIQPPRMLDQSISATVQGFAGMVQMNMTVADV